MSKRYSGIKIIITYKINKQTLANIDKIKENMQLYNKNTNDKVADHSLIHSPEISNSN